MNKGIEISQHGTVRIDGMTVGSFHERWPGATQALIERLNPPANRSNPNYPARQAALYADSILTTRTPLEPMNFLQARDWIKSHLNDDYAQAWFEDVVAGLIKFCPNP